MPEPAPAPPGWATLVQRRELTCHAVRVDAPALIAPQSGDKILRWPGHRVTAPTGGYVFLPAGFVGDITNRPGPDGSYRARVLVLPPLADPAPPHTPAPPMARVLADCPDAFHRAFTRAFDLARTPSDLPAAVLHHRIAEVSLWLAQVFGIPVLAASDATLSGRIRRLVGGDPAHGWTAPETARHLGLAEATLRRALAREGAGFAELLADVRMLHAMNLIQGSDRSILQVAQDCGYQSASRFARRFQRRFGFAPTEIRGHRRNLIETEQKLRGKGAMKTLNPAGIPSSDA